jgi:hypothetical protein
MALVAAAMLVYFWWKGWLRSSDRMPAESLPPRSQENSEPGENAHK